MEEKTTSTIKIKPRFYVDKECNWFQDGKPITHKRIYIYNYQNLIKDNDLFYVSEGNSKAYVYFEDKPFIVKRVNYIGNKIIILLNDFTEEYLDMESLYFSKNIPYCMVKDKRFEAKFSRAALFQLSEKINEKDGKFILLNNLINIKN